MDAKSLSKAEDRVNRNNQIHETVKLGDNVKVGFNNLIFEDVIIGDNVDIGNNVIIYPDTRIGNRVQIQDNVVLGKRNFVSTGTGSSRKFFENVAPLIIDEDVIIGTGVICYAGSTIGSKSILADRAIIREGCKIGIHVKIGKHSIIEYEVVLEENVSVQAQVLIGEFMTIGKNTLIGPHVSTACDKYMDAEHRDALEPPSIKNDVRVGENVTILPGMEIGEKSIISAGSVVEKNIPPSVVAMGHPAKPIRRIRPKKVLNEPTEK